MTSCGDKETTLEKLFYSATDPLSYIENGPAMTTLFYKVCERDGAKFDEAIRLIRLFMEAAYDEGLKSKDE